ncbi:MAG: hypothetical protein ACK4S4_09675 [Pyrinomonadaceae bacterium]
MNDDKLQRTSSRAIEKGQYALAFVVIAAMLVVVDFPIFVILFFAIFAYFLWKIFSSASRSETRDIFEFYLAANDILRDDDRRWFGFEVHDVIMRGERIIASMATAPPLVRFALGALYNKVGDHAAAASLLAAVLESEAGSEMSMTAPSDELRNYVRILRKIEREPAEAPLTSAAIRALERARKNRGQALLDESRRLMEAAAIADAAAELEAGPDRERRLAAKCAAEEAADQNEETPRRAASFKDPDVSADAKPAAGGTRFGDRKSISEVLHDIYDGNVQ